MYKTYRKNGYDVMYYRFDSISEFVDYLKNAPIQSDAFYNLSSESGSYSFTQTRSFDEAIDLIKYGYHDDFEKLVQLKDIFNFEICLFSKCLQMWHLLCAIFHCIRISFLPTLCFSPL